MSWKRVAFVTILLMILVGGILYFLRFYSSQAIFPIHGEYVKIEETKVYIRARGEGRTVLFLHGFPYHSETFYNIVRHPLPGYRFITVDFPGLGLSEKKLNKPFTPADLALIVKLFLDRIDVQEVDLVGHDLGGGVAIVYAATYPQMVKKVVLLAPDSSAGNSASIMSRCWQLPLIGELWATIRLDRGFIRSLLKASWSPASSAWNQVVERYTHTLDTSYGRQGFLKLHRGRLNFDYLYYEGRVKADCLIISGEQDPIFPPRQARRLLQSLDRSRLEIIPNVGHLPQEEAADTVYGLIRTFLLEQ